MSTLHRRLRAPVILLVTAFAYPGSPPSVPSLSASEKPPSNCDLNGGRVERVPVALEPGQFWQAAVFQEQDMDVTLKLLGPSGNTVVERNLARGRGGLEILSVVAESAGEHVLEVRATGPPRPFTCRWTFEGPRVATETDIQWVALEQKVQDARPLLDSTNPEDRARGVETAELALVHARAAGDREAQVALLLRATLTRNYSSEHRRALEHLRELLPLVRAMGEAYLELYALMEMTGQLLYLNEFAESVSTAEAAAALARRMGDAFGEARSLDNKCAALLYLGQFDAAAEAGEAAVRMMRAIPHREGEGTALSKLSMVHARKGDLQAALDGFSAVLAINREIKDPLGEATALANLANVALTMGDAEGSLAASRSALDLYRSMGSKLQEGSVLTNMGYAQFMKDDLAGARESYEQALVARRATGDRRGEAYTLSNLAAVEMRSGNAGRAVELLKTSGALLEPMKDQIGLTGQRISLALAEVELKELASARTHAEQALALARGNAREAPALYALATVERAEGKLQESLARVEEAASQIESLRHQLRSAELRSYLPATRLSREIGEFHLDLLVALHEREPGGAYLVRAFEASERTRARSLLDLVQESAAHIRTSVDRALLDRERDARARLNAKLNQELRLPPTATAEQRAAVAAEVRALMEECERLADQIRTASPRYAELIQPRPLDTAALRERVLDDDTALLQYFVGDGRSFLWVLSRAGLEVHRLPGRREIEAAVWPAYRAWSDPPPPAGGKSTLVAETRADASPEAILGRMLLGPVAKAIEGKRLLIVADGPLHYVAFAALPDPGHAGEPLVAHHEVVSEPSASVLAALREQTAGRKSAPHALAVVADPVFSRDDERVVSRKAPALASASAPAGGTGAAEAWSRVTRDALAGGPPPRLPFSRREARAVLALVAAPERREALDFDASRETVTGGILGQYRVVHFATHGYVNSQRPQLSGIVLSLVDSAGRPQDGFLTASDLYNLDLNADLLVLSGCETALGRELRGEGLVGLARAFMYAGAPRVVASNWKVDDAATAALMTAFYRGMFKDRLAPAAALRAAQLDLLKGSRFRHPYYWAGFQIQGEWR